MGAKDQTKLRTGRMWCRSILALGIGASLAANIAAADPSVIGRVVAAWSPVALLLTVELITRVPIARGSWLSKTRVAAAGALAGIAAWVSYWHMVEVATAHGEGTVAAHLLPLSVDGLVIVSAVSLAEIGSRITDRPARRQPPATTSEPVTKPETPASSTIGDLVRQLTAEHAEWTQQQVAAAAGCSERTVRRHMNDSNGKVTV